MGSERKLIIVICIPRGDEVGQVQACLRDESGCCLLVNRGHKIAQCSLHSSTWSMREPVPFMWLVEETGNCVAWQLHDGEVTAIML